MSRVKPLILIVEDEEAIVMGIEENLKYAGYDVAKAADGVEGLRLCQEAKPDLLLLDIMLPGMSGYDVCRRLRDKGNPVSVIMLTARQDEFDKVHGFEMGADDYVTKPFSVNELLSRIKAVLSRGQRRTTGPRMYRFGASELDVDARVLKRNGKELALTHTEFDLLAYFCQNAGKALSRESVMNDVWGTQYFGTQRSLDSFVASLRSKIEEKKSKPRHILTVHGVGYKFMT